VIAFAVTDSSPSNLPAFIPNKPSVANSRAGNNVGATITERRSLLNGAADGAGEHNLPLLSSTTFNFSSNHLVLLSRKEYRSCAVFLLLDRDTQRVDRLHDFIKAHHRVPGQAYCVASKVNSADKLYLIEWVRLDTRHARSSVVPAPADGAGGFPLD
jgi:hypothetical protein